MQTVNTKVKQMNYQKALGLIHFGEIKWTVVDEMQLGSSTFPSNTTWR